METQDGKRKRVMVFDDESVVRSLLTFLFHRRGYEVFTFTDPGICPLYLRKQDLCPLGKICADVIISDVHMPRVSGLKFVEEQKKKGCAVRNIALMSGAWTLVDIQHAQELDCKIFYKPIHPAQIDAWLDDCERNADPDRVLAEWPTDYDIREEGEKLAARHPVPQNGRSGAG